MKAIEIDPWNPRPDRVDEVAGRLRRGEIVAFPTDSTWTLTADASQRGALQKLQRLRASMHGDDPDRPETGRAPLSLLCASISEIGKYTNLEQHQFRLLRRIFPGPYTVLLPASRQVPRLIQSKRRIIGVRLPDYPIATAIIAAMEHPLVATTARIDDDRLVASAGDLAGPYIHHVDAVVHTDPIVPEESTVIDATTDPPTVIRAGKGELEDHWLVPDE